MSFASRAKQRAEALAPISTAVELITPDQARELLKNNASNRNVSTRIVSLYADEMRADNWTLNGESVKLAFDGSLIDGQHRLLACIKAGKPFRTFVVRGLAREVFDSVDIGKPRTPRDILSSLRVVNAAQVSMALRLLAYWENGQGTLERRDFSRTNYVSLLDQHPGTVESARFILELQKQYGRLLLSDGVATFAHYLLSKVDGKLAEQFFTHLYSGEELERGNPMLLLRTRFIQAAMNRVRINEIDQASLLIKAWNAFYRKSPIRHLRCGRGEQFPKVEGLAA